MLMVASQWLEIGEKLMWKYDETRYFVFFPWSKPSIELPLFSKIISRIFILLLVENYNKIRYKIFQNRF